MFLNDVWLDCFCIVLFLSFDILLQPNAETEDGVTPLLSAVAASSLACLELLVQVSPKSLTSLYMAIKFFELVGCVTGFIAIYKVNGFFCRPKRGNIV